MKLTQQQADEISPHTIPPHIFAPELGWFFIPCECGASIIYKGGGCRYSQHFPSFGPDGSTRLSEPFLPGSALCRYSGRSMTLEDAVQRDNELTEDERLARRFASASWDTRMWSWARRNLPHLVRTLLDRVRTLP